MYYNNLFETDKKSRSVKLFWDLQAVHTESELVDEKSKLQWVSCLYKNYKTIYRYSFAKLLNSDLETRDARIRKERSRPP